MPTQRELDAEARRLYQLLEKRDVRIVFAESCTGGLVSATMTRLPGVSRYLCGSAVVYQLATKASWLNVARGVLEHPGPVSREVASQMAVRVLSKTPHADLAAAVTGHLGPDAPAGQDGLVYVAVARRSSAKPSQRPRLRVRKLQLSASQPGRGGESARRRRIRRQREAALAVLALARSALSDHPL